MCMKYRRTALIRVAVLATAALALAAHGPTAQAAAASVTLGQTGSGVVCPANTTVVQTATAAGGPSHAVPAGGGVVTSWAYQAGPAGKVQLVFAGAEAAGVRKIVAKSAKGTASVSGLVTFSARIPVPAGAVLGVWVEKLGMNCMSEAPAGNTAQTAALDPDVSGDFTAATTPAFVRANVSAVLEPDTDGDGFG